LKRILPILSIILITAIHSPGQARLAPTQDAERIMNFYPNPATSFITFDFKKGYDKGYDIQIFNFLGRLVFEQKNISPKTTVDLSVYTRGIYIYYLRERDGKIVESGKFQVAK
jgi:hypothetical protein